MKKLLLIIVCLFIGKMACIAQSFPWNVPGDDSGFQYNMNVCGIVKIDDIEQSSLTLAVGAFFGDECRGAVYPYEYNGHVEYWITILGDVVGETLTFKLYDYDTDEVLDLECTSTIDFVIDGLIGLDEHFIFSFISPTYTVTLTANPTEGGTVSGDGEYPVGSEVTVTATPNTGYNFVNWTKGEDIVSTDATYSFTLEANVELVANFESAFTTFSLTIKGHDEADAGGYYLIAPPFDNINPADPAQATGVLGEGYDFYYFDQEKDLEWINYHSNPFNMTSGKGYLYASPTTVTLTFIGDPYSGDGKSVSLVKKEGAQFEGWNLIGNPLNVEAQMDNDTRRPFYVLDGTTPTNEFIPMSKDAKIAPMQGLFVLAEVEGEQIQFVESTSDKTETLIFKVSRNRGAMLDRAIVQFDGCSTLPKFMLDPDHTKMYIPEGNKQFAVVNSSRENSLPVNFKAQENGTYTFGVEMENLEMEYLHLIDNLTGTDVNLLDNPAYSFEARTTDNASRFTLVFRAMTNVDENSQRNFCFVNGSQLNFCMDVQGSEVGIVDMAGRTVMQQVMDGNSINLPALSQGVYVVRLSGNDNTMTQKIVIK